MVESTSDLETVILSTNTYIHLPRNSILAIEHKISNTLRSLHQSKTISSPRYCHEKTSASPCPHFFGQPMLTIPIFPSIPSWRPGFQQSTTRPDISPDSPPTTWPQTEPHHQFKPVRQHHKWHSPRSNRHSWEFWQSLSLHQHTLERNMSHLK